MLQRRKTQMRSRWHPGKTWFILDFEQVFREYKRSARKFSTISTTHLQCANLAPHFLFFYPYLSLILVLRYCFDLFVLHIFFASHLNFCKKQDTQINSCSLIYSVMRHVHLMCTRHQSQLHRRQFLLDFKGRIR